MEYEYIKIKIDGTEIDDFYRDIISVEVETDEGLAAMCRIRLPLILVEDGEWTYLDDGDFAPWKKIELRGGFENGMEDLFSGYITHVKPTFESDSTMCCLEVWGMDESVVMDREEILKDWPNKKDSDIAAEIFGLYGFRAGTEDTRVVHDEKVSTIVQRETDMQFLKRLARRNGFECYVEGGMGYFRSPRLDEPPQPVLACHFGKQTNLTRIALEVNAQAPVNAVMFNVDRLNKEVLESTADAGLQTVLGRDDSGGLASADIPPPLIYAGMNAVSGKPEMDTLCRAVYHQSDWFVTVEGEITGNHYGHVLKTRATVTVKGIGRTYSGVYYVSHVTHTFDARGYRQSFKAKRNALMPKGNESWEDGGLL